MRVQLSSAGERSSVFLRWLAVSLYVRQAALALSSARHLMELLIADQTRDVEKNHEILAALKVNKIENFFGSEFEFFTILLLVLLKY
jgi:hypothetical protein